MKRIALAVALASLVSNIGLTDESPVGLAPRNSSPGNVTLDDTTFQSVQPRRASPRDSRSGQGEFSDAQTENSLQFRNESSQDLQFVRTNGAFQVDTTISSGQELDLSLEPGWTYHLQTPDGRRTRIPDSLSGQLIRASEGRNGVVKLQIERADVVSSSRRNRIRRLSSALGVSLKDEGKGKLRITEVGVGMGSELRMLTGDVIIDMTTVAARDNQGQPLPGRFVSMVKLKAANGQLIEINLESSELPVWIR